MLMLKYHNNPPNFFGRYMGRAEIFLPENSNNCSLLLTNTTADDLGKYRCSFYSKGIYKKAFVYLNISGESVIRHAYLQYLLGHSFTHEFTAELWSNFNSSHLSPASYNVCQKGDSSLKVFQCDVEGRYKEAEIQWNLDGQLLTDSPTTRITHANTLDAPSGLYHFTSKLITKLNGTSSPVCDVKAKGVSTIITSVCASEIGNRFYLFQRR